MQCWILSRAAGFALALASAAAQGTIDAKTYENVFTVNWPMFEKMTEKVVSEHATSVLDLGTGPGQPATLIAQTLPSAKVTATDVQDAMIAKAKKRAEGLGNIDFRVTPAEDLSAFDAQSFDALTMSFVLMFVKDRPKCLEEVGRVLRQGGAAFVAVWKKIPLVTLSAQAFEQVSGKPLPLEQLPVNPLALQAEDAVEEIVKASNGALVVESTEILEYPFALGTAAETCEAAMIPLGGMVQKLVTEGKKDAKEQFCSTFAKMLEERGMKTSKGVFEVTGSAAQLLTLRKAGRGTEQSEL